MHAPCNGSSTSPVPDCRPCSSCDAGKYMSGGGCANGSASSPLDRICSPCATCLPGKQRLLNPCTTGRSLHDTVTCEDCPSCNAGSYISLPCDGVSERQRQCLPCKQCPIGFWRRAPLCAQGISTQDDVQCLPCPNCSVGEFIRSRCSGTSFSVTTDRTCASCPKPACRAGEYMSSPCTGSSALSSGDAVCRQCTRGCPVGSYMLERVCASGNGTLDAAPTSCIPCRNECRENYFLLKGCSGFGIGVPDFSCVECTCPDGLPPVKRCTDLKLNHQCSNGCRGMECMPGIVIQGSTSASFTMRTTSLAAKQTTSSSKAESTPSPPSAPQQAPSSTEILIYSIVGGVVLVLLAACFVWRYCMCCKNV
jgi:hypothetical protein